jgi:starch synthase (maltosyl-transferring)
MRRTNLPGDSAPDVAATRRGPKEVARKAPGASRAALKKREKASLDAGWNRRVIVEQIRPSVDGGRFPIKRTPGDRVEVTARIFADGHDLVAAAVLWRRIESPSWQEAPMTPLGNDEWTGAFTVMELGRYEYTIEAWVDRFGSWQRRLQAKRGAGQDVSSDLVEGAAIVRKSAARSEARDWLLGVADILGGQAAQTNDIETRAAAGLDPHLAAVMAALADRSRATRAETALPVVVNRERA